MANPTNHWKLGLFVLVGAVLALSTVGWLVARSLSQEVGRYVSFFDESVQGLEIGSPIKFRGVTIGSVGQIDVAPDHRHVEVTCDLGKAVLSRLGLDVAAGATKAGADKKLEQAIDLRAQLVSSGLTGVKFLQLDFFTVSDHPPPGLPFPVPKNYIPATSSTLKDIEDSLVRTTNNLPEITAQVTRILGRIDLLVGALSDSKLTAQMSATFVGLHETVTRVNLILARVDGDKGLFQSVQLASNAVGDTARNAVGLGSQLQATLRTVQETAESIRMFVDALERDPDMLVKGRREERKP